MLSFNSAPGNFFNRFGKLGLVVKQAKSYQTFQLTNMVDTVNGVVAQFNAESDLQAVFGNGYLSALGVVEGACNTSKNLAQKTLNRMIYRDNPQPGQTLTSTNNRLSILELIRQMRVQGVSVLAMPISVIPPVNAIGASFTGVGSGAVVTSTKRASDGLVLENSFSETITMICKSDSYTGGAIQGNESFSLTGQGMVSDVFAFNWPGGSSCSKQLSAIDGDAGIGSGNLLTNSGFSSWSNNLPTGWLSPVGSSLFSQSSGITYSASSCLQITGDGATQAQLQQLVSLSGLTQYPVNLYLRRDAVAPASGVLQVDLIDQNGNIIQDANGVNNSFTIDLTQLNTLFTPYGGAFRTPAVLPSQMYIRYWLSTPLTNSRSVFVAKTALGSGMTQAYISGPSFAVFAGNVPFQLNDYSFIPVVNSRGNGNTLSTFQTLTSQFFTEMVSFGYLLPSSNTPTIPDSLIG